MPLSPRQSLATALESITDIARCAHRAGVTPREFANAQVARPCPTIPFLRICVAIQHDPLPSIPHKMPEKPSDFDFGFFAMGFRIRRALNLHDENAAASAIGVSRETVCRIERGDRLLIGVVLRACTYAGIHVFGYMAPANWPVMHVSHETSVGVTRGQTVG